MNVLIRVLITAVALAVAAALVPGIEVQGNTTLSRVLTLVVVAHRYLFGPQDAAAEPGVVTTPTWPDVLRAVASAA